jgi:FecR-like protein
VDPMPDIAWARIERGLWSRLDGAPPAPRPPRPPRSAWWLALPAAVAVAVAAAVLVVVLRGGATGDESSRIVAGAAPSSITFADSHVALDANSAATVAHEAGSPLVVLERGAAWFTVAPRGDRAPFLVRAGDATVRVVGTHFRVAHSDERVDVEVEHGLVEVTFRGTRVDVGEGQTWSSTAPTSVVRVAPDDDRATYEHFAALESSDPDAAIAGYLALANGPHGTSRWAEVALFAAGRLAADRGDPRAADLLATYLARYPSGANAADAKALAAHLNASKGERP